MGPLSRQTTDRDIGPNLLKAAPLLNPLAFRLFDDEANHSGNLHHSSRMPSCSDADGTV